MIQAHDIVVFDKKEIKKELPEWLKLSQQVYGVVRRAEPADRGFCRLVCEVRHEISAWLLRFQVTLFKSDLSMDNH